MSTSSKEIKNAKREARTKKRPKWEGLDSIEPEVLKSYDKHSHSDNDGLDLLSSIEIQLLQ